MSSSNEIKSEKILIKDVFEKWFNVPGYVSRRGPGPPTNKAASSP